MVAMVGLKSCKKLCFYQNNSDLLLLKKRAEGNRRRLGGGRGSVCLCTPILTGHNHTLFQDNFLFATANCHSKENRNGSVISGCCRTTTACGVSGSE